REGTAVTGGGRGAAPAPGVLNPPARGGPPVLVRPPWQKPPAGGLGGGGGVVVAGPVWGGDEGGGGWGALRGVGESVELAADDGRVARAGQSLAEAFQRVGPAIEVVLEKLRTATRSPDEIELEFGLKLGGETGLIFAKGSAETTFNVRLTWQRP